MVSRNNWIDYPSRRRRRWTWKSQQSKYFPSGKTRRYGGKYRPHSSRYARQHGWSYRAGTGWQAGPVHRVIGGNLQTRSLTAEGYFTAWTPVLS